jgi:hypothetical protein
MFGWGMQFIGSMRQTKFDAATIALADLNRHSVEALVKVANAVGACVLRRASRQTFSPPPRTTRSPALHRRSDFRKNPARRPAPLRSRALRAITGY